MPDPLLQQALAAASSSPGALTDEQAVALLGADGDDLEALAALADDLRRRRVGTP